MSTNRNRSLIPAFLRDVRVLQILGQIIFVIVVVVMIAAVVAAIIASLSAKNLTPNFSFLQQRAGFDISNAPSWYSSDNNYWAAFQVGLQNSLRVIALGLVLTTIVGVLMGIFLLSSNWLVRTIARVYVELLRNTPMLVQLFVWYFIVMLSLPPFTQPLTFPAEGVSLLTFRLLLYVALYFGVRWMAGNLLPSAPKRAALTGALVGLIAVTEIAFRVTAPGIYGSGSMGNVAFWGYMVLSGLLLLGAWFAPAALRWTLLGLAGGQWVGGLLFYFGIMPQGGLRMELYPAIFITVRGFVFPEILPTARLAEWLAFVGVGAALAGMQWVYLGRLTETTGRPFPRGGYAVLAVIGFALAGWVFVGMEPTPTTVPVQQEGATVFMTVEEARNQGLFTEADEQLYSTQPILFILPQQKVNRAGLTTGFLSGTEVPPEFMALLLGLVIYTSSFIAEIVRAGILAVPRGQIEAARALGLTTPQTLRLIILPQALRVIIPPLGNQYLNLSKNSSLATAIAYADAVLVTTTIMNQSGQSVTGITMLMIFYLIISLLISLFTNTFNRRFKLVTR